MSKQRIIDIPGFGPVLCHKNSQARRIIVHVSASRGVWVTLPARQAYGQAVTMVARHREWITRNLSKINRDRENVKSLQDKFEAMDKIKAKVELTARFQELAQGRGFAYDKLSIRNQRTRWGSCSSKNSISLNIKLALLPDKLRDYVMLHELVHTYVHNHGPEFHAELEKHVENHEVLSRWLRAFGLRVM